jgi:hypothetical protein
MMVAVMVDQMALILVDLRDWRDEKTVDERVF